MRRSLRISFGKSSPILIGAYQNEIYPPCRKALGDVEMLPIAHNAQSNWAVHPTGTKAQKAVIAKAAYLVREQHRYVAAG